MTDYHLICHTCREQVSFIDGPGEDELLPFLKFHANQRCKLECSRDGDSSLGDWFDSEGYRKNYDARVDKSTC